MASVKLGTLAIRTIAKPISSRLKVEALEHPFFRKICVQVAQKIYKAEMRLGTFVLGQPPRAVKPLSEAKAIDRGANFLAESFLFGVAASLIIAETWRSSNKESKRRETVADALDELRGQNVKLKETIESLRCDFREQIEDERARSDELARILENIVNIGLRGGWVAFQDSPMTVPKMDIPRRPRLEAAPPVPQEQQSSLTPESEQEDTK
ncbi:hypothetical protein M422DRAFT_36100 [Sphaerobolus stellatus SS14]|uniref:OPA3-like protein n=1 Tax=Sphaerobolus stellatus (strain SS14) TaxID=990650 RepID=A0A0C9V2W1_SPHS4|nr:hypothetical protein M422DRAFT_36100 [Sphaerobolus stellatus SS14]